MLIEYQGVSGRGGESDQGKKVRKAETGFAGKLWNQRIKGDLSSRPQEDQTQACLEDHSSQLVDSLFWALPLKELTVSVVFPPLKHQILKRKKLLGPI